MSGLEALARRRSLIYIAIITSSRQNTKESALRGWNPSDNRKVASVLY
jgi:hypothetical protein